MARDHISVNLQAWREDDMALVCGIANAGGGTILIQTSSRDYSSGLRKMRKTFESIPALTQRDLGITCTTEPVMDGTQLCLAINIPRSDHPLSYFGKYYLYANGKNQAVGKSAVERAQQGAADSHWEMQIQPKMKREDIDEDVLSAMAAREDLAGSDGTASQRVIVEALEENGLLDHVTDTLTNVGALLLHREPHALIRGALVRVARLDELGNIVGDVVEVTGPVTKQLAGAVRVVREMVGALGDAVPGDGGAGDEEQNKLSASRLAPTNLAEQDAQNKEEGARTLAPTYPGGTGNDSSPTYSGGTDGISGVPEAALKEALLNALVHKDYASGAPINVSVYATRVFVENAGQLPEGWTAETLLARHASKPSNPTLARSLRKAGLFRNWGNGIELIRQVCANEGGCSPVFEAHGDQVVVEFRFAESAGTSEGTKQGERRSHARAHEDGQDSQNKWSAGTPAPTNLAESDAQNKLSASRLAPTPGGTSDEATPTYSSENGNESGVPKAPAAPIAPAAASESAGTGAVGRFTKTGPAAKGAKFNERSFAAANDIYLTSTDEYVLKVLETNGRATAPRIAEVLGVSESTVRRSFRKLREMEIIVRVGSDKAGYWKVVL